ncbi:MAG: hypothetical protein JWM74_4917 [Myxococcaceae bacterium]|nr:hypothetical protein [Myxococcaceae bacterium]
MGLYADRVRETTTSTGTGIVTLAGAVAGFRTFASALSTGERVRYAIVDSTTGAWETGDGVFTTSGTTLTRENVFSSSNGNALVSFAAGTKDVWIDLPATSIADIGLTLAFATRIVSQ